MTRRCRSQLPAAIDPHEVALLIFGLFKALGGVLPGLLSECEQARVLGQPNDVIDLVPITPTQHLPAAEARVASKDDLHIGPALSQPGDQQLEDCPSVAGRIDIAGTQVTHQELLAAENIER